MAVVCRHVLKDKGCYGARNALLARSVNTWRIGRSNPRRCGPTSEWPKMRPQSPWLQVEVLGSGTLDFSGALGG